MLDFKGKDKRAKDVCLYYANKLNAKNLMGILASQDPVRSKEEALELSRFFWKMVDASIEDRDNGIKILDEADLQHWMERSMNIFSGYLRSIGYEDQWEQVSDEA
jgi:hypothetical protein